MPLIDEAEPAKRVAELLRVRAGRRGANDPRSGMAAAFPSGTLSLDDAIGVRRAIRDFADRPVLRSEVELVLEHARAMLQRWWPAVSQPAYGLTVIVAADHVTGLEHGLYSYAENTGPRRLPADARLLRGLRAAYAPAPVLLAICGDLPWALSPEGPDYGGLLTAAGALGYASWLSAVSLGLAGCAFGGAAQELTDIAVDIAPGLRHLFTIALGHPEKSVDEAG